MFVRFRHCRARLQVSILQSRRVDGKVRSDHVAGLGTVAQPASVVDRAEFWRGLPQRIGRLTNDPTPLLAAIHARIPLPTPQEQQAAMLETAAAEVRLWEQLRDLNQGLADDNRDLAANAERKAAAAQAAADSAKAKAEAATERVARLQRGEPVASGPRQT